MSFAPHPLKRCTTVSQGFFYYGILMQASAITQHCPANSEPSLLRYRMVQAQRSRVRQKASEDREETSRNWNVGTINLIKEAGRGQSCNHQPCPQYNTPVTEPLSSPTLGNLQNRNAANQVLSRFRSRPTPIYKMSEPFPVGLRLSSHLKPLCRHLSEAMTGP